MLLLKPQMSGRVMWPSKALRAVQEVEMRLAIVMQLSRRPMKERLLPSCSMRSEQRGIRPKLQALKRKGLRGQEACKEGCLQ